MFRRGRDMAPWLGLVPRQHSTGGKSTLGSTAQQVGIRCEPSPTRTRESRGTQNEGIQLGNERLCGEDFRPCRSQVGDDFIAYTRPDFAGQ
jgi:hypothetical protein